MAGSGETAEQFGEAIAIRIARREDVPAIVALFAADALGGHGDTTEPDALADYLAAFDRISASPQDRLYVAELDGEMVGTFQTTLMVSMSGRGAASLNVEAVQTRADMRGRGIGEAIAIRYAMEGAKVVVSARTVDDGDHILPGSINSVVKRIRDAGGEAMAVKCELGNKEEREAAVRQVHRQVLDWMIDQMLIEQAAARLGIVMDDAAVEAEFAKARGNDANQFAKWLKDLGGIKGNQTSIANNYYAQGWYDKATQ